MFNIPGYNLVHVNRCKGIGGGGVIYVNMILILKYVKIYLTLLIYVILYSLN